MSLQESKKSENTSANKRVYIALFLAIYKKEGPYLCSMKSFDVPIIYRSPLISAIKKKRKEQDRMKKDFTPTLLDFGPLQISLARHFGFCYGVENAIEIAFRTLDQNPGKRIFLLSEMIHNPQVNADLLSRGIRFLQDTSGHTLIPFEELNKEDIVLIPAFGTTREIESQLHERGITTAAYNTTCPFVEKVWNRSESISKKNFTVIIHGKPTHEETRATFSHAAAHGPAMVIKDMEEAKQLAAVIRGDKSATEFFAIFSNQYSVNFDPVVDLKRIGVVNQTTMLASDTQAIADFLKTTILEKEGKEEQVADTRDTLCYATLDNQTAVQGMLQQSADLAMVVGGYNSSNTSHLVELCELTLPTYYIESAQKILGESSIMHYDMHTQTEKITSNFLPTKRPLHILITSGASCPDALVEGVIERLLELVPGTTSLDAVLANYQA
jgi:4-hydroxy-3-methylbut-2-enyl diphosphate reductase